MYDGRLNSNANKILCSVMLVILIGGTFHKTDKSFNTFFWSTIKIGLSIKVVRGALQPLSYNSDKNYQFPLISSHR